MMKMNEVKSKNLFIRVSEQEKAVIEQNAKKCGLSVSEYLRQRALGYMPKALLPEAFFSFSNKLDELCIVCEGKITADTEQKIIALIDRITEELILPQREKAVVQTGSPQSLLCGGKGASTKWGAFAACGESDEWSVMRRGDYGLLACQGQAEGSNRLRKESR